MLTAYTLSGGGGADTWLIRMNSGGTGFEIYTGAQADIDNPTGTPVTFSRTAYTGIEVTAGSGDDTLIVDGRGTPAGAMPPITFTGGDGDDTVRLKAVMDGASGVTLTASTTSAGWARIYDNAEYRSPDVAWDGWHEDPIEVYAGAMIVVPVDLGPYENMLSYAGFTSGVRFDVSQHFNSTDPGYPSGSPPLLGGMGTMKEGAGAVMVVTTMASTWTAPYSMPGTTLDLNDNAFIWDYTGSTPAAKLRDFLLNGRNGGTWDGTNGIRSSTAANDAKGAHGIGYVEASELLNLSGAATDDWSYAPGVGETVGATTLLAKYTWYGDVNLDGRVDDTDFQKVRESIDYYARNAGSRGTYATWSHGDFNYDGVIDDEDMNLMVDGYLGWLDESFVPDPMTINNFYHDITLGSLAYPADATGLNDAVYYLANNGGGMVYVPGVIDLGTTPLYLNGYSNIRIVADPTYMGTCGLSVSGVPSAVDPGFDGHRAMVVMKHCSNIAIVGLDFDGNSYDAAAMDIVDSDHVTVARSEFHDSGGYAAIWGQGNEHSVFAHNEIHDVDSVGIYAGNYGDKPISGGDPYYLHESEYDEAPMMIGNTFRRVAGDFIIGHMDDALIAANDIDGDMDGTGTRGGYSGIALCATGIGSGNADEVESEDCVIFRNRIVNVAGQGIQSDVAGPNYGRSRAMTRNITVFQNDISATTDAGMYLAAIQAWNIIENSIDHTHWGGIQVFWGGSDTIIKDNDLNYTGLTEALGGINIEISDQIYDGVNHNVSGLQIIGNTCLNSNGNGIALYNQVLTVTFTASNLLIVGNRCATETSGGVGFHFQNGNSGITIDLSFSSTEFHDNDFDSTNI